MDSKQYTRKIANLQQTLGLSDLQTNYANWLGKLLLGTAAGGAALRGTTGLAQILTSNMKRPPAPPQPSVINIPYRVPPKEEEQKKLANVKKANIFDNYLLRGGPGAGGPDAKDFWDIPAMPAITLGTFLGGGIGGYKLMDKLVKNRQQSMREQDLEQARQEYQQSLLDQFKPIPPARVKHVSLKKPTLNKAADSQLSKDEIKSIIEKTAEPDSKVSKLTEKLDQLADKVLESLEKKGGWYDDWIPDGWYDRYLPWNRDPKGLPGKGTRLAASYYSLAVPAVALASGATMYNYAKANDPEKEVAKALKKQYQEHWQERPADVFARLLPVDEKGQLTHDEHNNNNGRLEPTIRTPLIKKSTSAEPNDINMKAEAFVRELLGD